MSWFRSKESENREKSEAYKTLTVFIFLIIGTVLGEGWIIYLAQ